MSGVRAAAGAGGADPIGPVFAALADPTRRHVIETLVREGSTSVPALSAELPITRQAVAKHLAALDDAGLIERAAGERGRREVRYRLRADALAPARDWMTETAAAWDDRLVRLKRSVERLNPSAGAPGRASR